MKKTILLLPALLLAGLIHAQVKTGTITYQEVIALDGMLHTGDDDALSASIAALLPKEHKTLKVLYFNEEGSLYENSARNTEKDEDISQGNIQMQIRQEMPDDKLFTDMKKKLYIEQKELMGRTFLVTGSMAALKWKFTGRQKLILGHPCQEAVSNSGGKEEDGLTAWYTTDIPVSTGPQMLRGLPGMVLEGTIGKNVTITATEIREEAPAASVLKAPSKGKKISAEAFKELAAAKREELRKQYGGNGNVIIRTTTINH